MSLLISILAWQAASADELTGILMVEIAGLKDETGNLYISVYDSDSAWRSEETVIGKRISIADALDGELVRTELQLPLGDYALAVFFDVDDNGELDSNFMGKPQEPVAWSNNAVWNFGPPSYEEAVFTLSAEPIILRISMRTL
ncbi:MAG: DUF2141 domain-containing protein [Halioglobus sp.]|nr:DUF2141 domain-containing protein [Halioglobus sp.]